MWKFWRLAKSAIADIKQLRNRSDLRIHNAGIKVRARADERFRLLHRLADGVRGAFEIRTLVAVGVRHRQQHAAKPRTPHLIFRWKIRATKKRLSVGQQKSRQRPATLPRNCADGGLIA